MSSLQLILVILPLGLDTLGVSVSLGMKSPPRAVAEEKEQRSDSSYGWLRVALLFALAEMLMPLVGLGVGYAVSLAVSNIMHYVGAVLLIGVGVWEVWEEGRAYLRKRSNRAAPVAPAKQVRQGHPVLLALSVSLDELAIGFSLGSLTAGKGVSPLLLCLLIGLQGFLLTITGLSLGRIARARLKPLQEASEYLSALLLIALGVWLLVS